MGTTAEADLLFLSHHQYDRDQHVYYNADGLPRFINDFSDAQPNGPHQWPKPQAAEFARLNERMLDDGVCSHDPRTLPAGVPATTQLSRKLESTKYKLKGLWPNILTTDASTRPQASPPCKQTL